MMTSVAKNYNMGNTQFHYLLTVMPFSLLLLLLHLCLLGASAVAAEPTTGAPTNASSQASEEEADFLFSRPKGFVGLRIGRFFPQAESDLYEMVTSELTIEKRDLRAWNFGVDGGFPLHERFDMVFSFDYLKRTKHSEFRDFVDEWNLPITQTTDYSQMPLTAGIKFLLVPHGRQVGQYAWLPSRLVPFISGGGGVLWYRFRQEGDFVDFNTMEIFYARLRSDGWTPAGYVGGGLDINVSRTGYLVLDIRYSWARSDLGRDFTGFEPIDLSGLRVTAGFQWRF